MDTEDVALGITEQLHSNRETIMSARRKAKDTASMTDKARYIVRDMSRRETRRKVFVVCLGMFLLAIIIIVIVVINGGTASAANVTISG